MAEEEEEYMYGEPSSDLERETHSLPCSSAPTSASLPTKARGWKWQKKWLHQFAWLKRDEGTMWCDVCRSIGMKSPFARGIGIKNPRRTDSMEHEKSANHRAAARATRNVAQCGSLPVALKHSASVHREQLVLHFATLYFLVKENLALVSWRDLYAALNVALTSVDRFVCSSSSPLCWSCLAGASALT